MLALFTFYAVPSSGKYKWTLVHLVNTNIGETLGPFDIYC